MGSCVARRAIVAPLVLAVCARFRLSPGELASRSLRPVVLDARAALSMDRRDRRDVVAFVAQTNRSCGTCALVEGHCERKVALCTNALAARGGAIENRYDDNYVPHTVPHTVQC